MASCLYPSPWSLVFIHHHGHWSLSITMTSCLYPSPWLLVFIHHHSHWSLSITMTSLSLSITMVAGLFPSPWLLVFIHHHGCWSFAITMVAGLSPSPWSLVFLHHHGRWSFSVTMTSGLYPSPWPVFFIHHDLCSLSITMVAYPSPSPLAFIHHHDLWPLSIILTCGLYPSPCLLIHHHDLWPLSITMTSGLYPSSWPVVFIHHHGRWSLSVTMTSRLYCYHDLLLLPVITTSYFYLSQVIHFILLLYHPAFGSQFFPSICWAQSETSLTLQDCGLKRNFPKLSSPGKGLLSSPYMSKDGMNSGFCFVFLNLYYCRKRLTAINHLKNVTPQSPEETECCATCVQEIKEDKPWIWSQIAPAAFFLVLPQIPSLFCKNKQKKQIFKYADSSSTFTVGKIWMRSQRIWKSQIAPAAFFLALPQIPSLFCKSKWTDFQICWLIIQIFPTGTCVGNGWRRYSFISCIQYRHSLCSPPACTGLSHPDRTPGALSSAYRSQKKIVFVVVVFSSR